MEWVEPSPEPILINVARACKALKADQVFGFVSPSHAYGLHSWHARSNQRPHAKMAMQSSPSSGVSGPPQLLGWSPIQVAYLWSVWRVRVVRERL